MFQKGNLKLNVIKEQKTEIIETIFQDTKSEIVDTKGDYRGGKITLKGCRDRAKFR